MTTPSSPDFAPGRPVVFRNATVLTMDDGHHVLHGGDVLISGERIVAVGHALEAPADAVEIDATGGIVMPRMIDTHRHMWQTAMRGYGADWTLTQYFVWNYLQWGKSFRPEDIYAGGLLSAIEAIDAGVATRGGAKALGLASVTGSLEPGKKADVVLIKNDDSPVMFPLLHPYGHVVFQAQRGDVHTVVVDGRVVKYGHRLRGTDLAKARQAVGQTVEYLQGELGPEAWTEGMHPEIPETRVVHNPYTYTYTEGGSAGRPAGSQDS